MIVEIRPIERQSWHGNTRKDGMPGKYIIIHAVLDAKLGKYKTGLDNEKADYVSKIDNKKITEEKYYGELIGRDLSSIHQGIDGDSFWDRSESSFKLDSVPMFLNLDNPKDYIKYKFSVASGHVASSKYAVEEGDAPYATHYVVDAKEDTARQAKKIEIKANCYAKLEKTSNDKKIQIITSLTQDDVSSYSSDQLTVKLTQLIEANAEQVLNLMTMNKEELFLMSLVTEAIVKKIIKRSKGGEYMFDDIIVGMNTKDIIEYFNKQANAQIRELFFKKVRPGFIE